MTGKLKNSNLETRLLQADVVCTKCGEKYGKYSVGCSSIWVGTCGVCGEKKGVTEVRDWGYLTRGINELKDKIKQQSKEVAKHMLTQEPIMTDDELDGVMMASYEEGELTCKFTEAELIALAEVLNAHEEEHPPGWNIDYDSAFEKIMELYGDNCVKYELSAAMKAYNAKYGTFGFDNELDTARWEGFREAFLLAIATELEAQ